MTFKLVVTDMDGTFLNSKDEISYENLKIVEELNERGILFSIATGRLDTMIKPYLRQIGNNNPVISCNGALVRNLSKGEFYHAQIIEREDFTKIIDICKKNSLVFAVYCEYTVYSESIEGRVKYFVERNEGLCEEEKVAIKIVGNIYKDLDEKVFKILVSNDNFELLEQVKEEINKIPGIEAIKSSSNLLDIMAAGVTKGNALKDLAETLKIKREEIIAIGDNHNDISMLQYAGYAIAVANAEQVVKDIADLVTVSNDEDGVAKALREVLNI
ncbi:Cof-type HAD-IIB family hydrolase [Clostridium sp. CF012]|uniref:Cof-type HAD-IIB family hydrolase n=1 Tax=Clostridium sp. CF012 TaxID=2843319 RepID=UPI001C0AF7C9|nr:Cof-type HAD-IIB family hydrolase [Clostridium sp. CF012]MBU3144682.1 Cof-type HAD-IIB family hydrolase [Clostridium sp. CF012]